MAFSIQDRTSNANHLTNNNSVSSYSTSLPFGASSFAADFEASSSQYLSIADGSQTGLDFSDAFTVEGWVRFESLPSSGNSMFFVCKDNNGVSRGYGFGLRNESGTLRLEGFIVDGSGNQDYYYTNWTPVVDTWYHLAMSAKASSISALTFTFYVDGGSASNGTAAVANNISAINNSSASFVLGSYNGTANFFDGQMDDWRAWDHERTGIQISTNYNSELVGNESGLVGYWPMEDFTSISLSPSLSPSVSVSRSPSVSVSASPSITPSSSISPSPSVSVSLSPSVSLSTSISPSPSTGYTLYTRGDETVLPTNNNDLETTYSDAEELQTATSDDERVGQTATSQYMIHQFKVFVGGETRCNVEWEGQSSVPPRLSTVYLQVYNHNTAAWVTIDSDNTSDAEVDFEMEAHISSLTDYKDSAQVVSCRVYQLAT